MPDLTIANQILSDITKKNKYISPVTLKDITLFQKFFRQEPYSYGNSWTYVTQGMYGLGPNNLGYKYFDGNNLSIFGLYPKIEDAKQNVFYWVRPMGKNISDKIMMLSKSFYNEYGFFSYVKKIHRDQYKSLLKNGFGDVCAFPWHSYSPQEDDTYPEQIVDVKNTINLANTLPRKKHLRKSFIRTLQINQEYDIKISMDNFSETAWKIAQTFFQSGIVMGQKHFFSNEFDYYNMIFSNQKNKEVLKGYVSVNKKPLGFYLMEQQSKDYTSIYALIVLRDKLKFLVDFLMLEILKNINTPYLNMGGSEDAGIHEFKQKFYPAAELQMFWATNFEASKKSSPKQN